MTTRQSNWDVDTEIIEDWGRLQVVIGNTDLTFYRGVPTIVEEWGTAEPFSDDTCGLRFPGITSFEDLDELPFEKFDNVSIQHIDPDGNIVKNVFEGIISSMDDNLSENDNGITVDCIGALYQADLMIKTPTINDYKFDIATAIKEELDLRIDHYGLRLKKMVEHTYCNIASRNRGSYNQLLTGWIQEQLAKAHTHIFLLGGEEAVALTWLDNDDYQGYFITGNWGTHLSFGRNDQFPNWGSWSYLILFFILFEDKPELQIADVVAFPGQDGIYSISQEGQVAIHSDDRFGDPTRHLGDRTGHPYEIKAMEVVPDEDNLGYWMMDRRGRVYAHGSAVNYGNGTWPLPTQFGREDEYVDMTCTPSGNGYYLLTKYGFVFPFGDATDYGVLRNQYLDSFSTESVAIAAYGVGYYVLASDGQVSEFGNPFVPHLGDRDNKNTDYVDMDVVDKNGATQGYALLRSNGELFNYSNFTNYGDGLWGIFPDAGGISHQWTLLKHPGRQLEMRVKDTWNTHWTVSVGTPGVTHTLSRDWTQLPNVYFGEGVNRYNCRWRNTKYPNIHPDDAPVWPGYEFSTTVNNTSAAVTTWQQGMKDRGWEINVDGVYSAGDERLCRQVQAQWGIEVDGEVGAQTWAATFQVGQGAGDASNAYYAPLAILPEVEPFIYDNSGAIQGANPYFDKNTVRVETYENYGEGINKGDSTISARSRLKKDTQYPGWYGTIVLKTDPEEGSRFDIRAGENILYKNYRGEDVKLHISAARISPGDMSVTLTVDSNSRDAMTLANILMREKETNDPGSIRTRRASAAKQSEDRTVVWDCENGAGVIPRHGITGGLWNVLKIPVGEFGEVVQTDIRNEATAAMSAAIFDRPITANELAALGSPSDEDYWKNFPEYKGLIISWGGFENMAGYYPGRQSDEDPKTGVLIDRASWVYWTTEAPWIWVALWCEQTTWIEGRLYPGTEGVGLVPDITSLPGD